MPTELKAHRAAVLLLLLLALPVAVNAATTVTLERDGMKIEQGEVCRFAAADRENPFQRWLSSQDVTCTAAGSAIAFPPGMWNVFARAGRDALSTDPHLIDGGVAPDFLSLTLAPAATVIPLLPPGYTGVIYATRRGNAFPVPEQTERVTVPAAEELWLFVLQKAVPVAVVPIPAIEAGAERRVDARNGGPSSIIGWLQVPEMDRAALRDARNVSLPHVRASAGGVSYDSDPLPALSLLNGAFVRVRGVPGGDVELDIAGRGWVPNRRRVKVAAALTVTADPLIARAAATIIVNWSTTDDLRSLDRSLGSCDEKESFPRIEISIAACPPPKRPNEPPDPSKCSVFRQETFEPDMTFGAVTVEDLVPGLYRAEMRFGKLPPIDAIVPAPALQQRSVRLAASYIQVYGGVTHGGEPLSEDVSIEFARGYGFASRESSEYRAVLRSLIGPDAQISVSACDDAPRAVVLADRPMTRNARFDIDVPANELTIKVSDTFTREALNGATVRYVVMSAAVPRRPLLSRVVTTGGDDRSNGSVVIRAVPEREVRLSVSHTGYQRQEVEPFSMTKSEKKTVDVQLVPLRGNRAKIVSQRPFESGAVFWFSSSGNETERAELAPDGTFVWATAHDPDETMAVVSLSHSLWVLRAPSVERRQTIELRFPDRPAREFDVVVRGADRRDSRHIGVVIGGVRAPQPALRQHQFLRGLTPVVRGVGPLRIRDIAETGPIDIILGPAVEEVSSRAGGMDFFALAAFGDAPRQRLAPGATSIVLELK